MGFLVMALSGCTENRKLHAEINDLTDKTAKVNTELQPLQAEYNALTKEAAELTALSRGTGPGGQKAKAAARPYLPGLEEDLKREKALADAMKADLETYRKKFLKD